MVDGGTLTAPSYTLPFVFGQTSGVKFMGRFGRWLYDFMRGRNGFDYFGYILSWLYLILLFIEIIVGFFSKTAASVISVILWILLIYMIFRIFSKNTAARSRENEKFRSFMSKIGLGSLGYGGGFGGSYDRFYEDKVNDGRYGKSRSGTGNAKKGKKQKLPRDKYHVYRICPGCKANIRLPKEKGQHSVRCPGCGTLFDVKI